MSLLLSFPHENLLVSGKSVCTDVFDAGEQAGAGVTPVEAVL